MIPGFLKRFDRERLAHPDGNPLDQFIQLLPWHWRVWLWWVRP